ncbi:LPD38 domain-containing protein [Mitsuokella jalaludinii]|uniref:LPD38 domain-containing protein n=1 Tax=Mitsuokella jalaludinii TaxID=187979 RepID=UPI00298C9993|nr:LPD38 domain-containing protein [Mitsuokella jalaludinii]
MPGFSTALYRPSVQNFVGGLEGDAGGAANYLGAFAKSQGEIDPDTGWNSLGDWLINNGTYWNDRADDVQQQFGTLNRYQNKGILQRLTDTDYLTDSRGLMADVFNGAGSSVPFIVTGALTPEIGIGGALARGAGGLLERMGMSTAGRAVASDLVQSGANDFARYALTGGPLEAAINAGGIYDDLKNQGLSDSEIFGKMNSMIGEELPVDMLTSGLYGAVLGGNTFSRLGQGGWKRAIAANALNTPANMLGEYMQEMTQQQLQNKYSGKPYGTFWNPTEDEMQAGRAAAMGALPMGMFGSARGAINSRRAAMAAADGGSVTGPEPVTPPAVPDPNVDPVAAAQLEGKNDDVPTADGVDVTNLDPQQYTQWYGEMLKSQGIDVPDATITVQTPKATGATGGAKAGAGANVMDAAQDFMGQHMENGANGCVEAVTKIGARYNPFLADELSKGVVNVDTLVSDAGDKVVPFDPNNLEAGDVIVYGDNDHVVLADGNGGYVGNSSSQQKVVQGGDYNNMGGLKPTKIIKTGNGVTAQNETANNGNAPAADLSSLPVGDIATAIAQNTGLPANFIWAQLSHESDGGNSKLAREDHNYGGVKGNDGEYLHFDNDQQFIDYMSNYYPKYREDGIYDAQTADQFAEALQHGGYFTADLGEYEGGMHRYLEQAGLSDSGTAGAPAEKQSTVNTMTQQQFGDMLNEKMIDFAGTNDDTVKTVFNDMSTSKDKALVSLFAPYMQDGVFANTAANRTALVNNDGFKKAMSMFLSKHLSDYAPAFENGHISFQQAEDALRPRHQVQAAQTAQAPNIQTAASPKMEAAAIQNVLSSFAQDKKNVARTEQEANLFDDMLDADDHFIDTPKNRQTLLKNYGAQLQNYVDDVMTPSLDDRVNQAIEQAVQNKDLNRMNILTQAKQANDTATLEKLVGPQTKQHVDIAAMLTPANTDVKNHVSSMMQGNAPVHQTATMEHQAPQNEVASTVQGNTPVQQAPATENEMPQGKVAPTIQANMPVNQTPTRMDNQQAAQQDAPKGQVSVTPLPTQKGQQSEGVRIAQPQQTIDEQNAQTDARIAEIKKTPLAQRKALGQQYLDTLRQNNVPFSEKKLAKPLMNGNPKAIEHVQRTYGDLLNTITPAEAAAASQHAPRTIQAATTARLGNMVSEITSGNTYKNASPVGKLAYLSAASAHAKTIGADKSARAIDSIIADVRKKAGFSGKGTTEGMTPEQKDEFYNAFYKQSLDDATAIRKEAADEKPANLKSLDNTIEMFKQELAKSKPTKEERKEVTHESTQNKSQNEPDKGAKNQDQHTKPESRKTADTQREAEESEVSTTKKAADNGGEYVLADGYRTESGKPLSEAGENEFILKPNGSKEFGEITNAISKAAKEQHNVDLAPGKIRLRAGNEIEGLRHAKAHESQAKADGYASIEDMIADVTENFDEIYERQPNTENGHVTYSLVKRGNKATGKMNGVSPIYFELQHDGDKGYYIVVSAIPKGDKSLKRGTAKDRLIYSSPGLGAATQSNAGAVSHDSHIVGAVNRGGSPTSDKSSGPSTHIIPHEQKEGTKNLDTGKVPAMGEPIHGIKGTETTVVTDSGKEIRVRYLVVPASRVITSHNAETMTPNKAYPQELQPRDRQRVSMQEQVTSMANELRPADLGAGRNLNQGAPIIRKDGVVLNGNGRAMAIQKATAAGGDKATAYRKYIFEHSKEFGLSRVNLAQVRKYMLVREVVDDIDADTMQDIIGSTTGGSRMGASEQAKADAKKIKPRDLERYVDNEQGDLTTAANQDFVAGILYRIVSKNERNAYTDEHGNVNADGIQRVKRALFSLAYDDDGLIDKMAESTDDNIRNVSRGLMNAAPAFARVNLAVADGQAYPYNADKTVSEAVKRLDALRSEDKPVKDYLNEQSMFSEYQDTDEMRDVLRFFDDNKRSGKKIGIFLNDIANSIMMQGDPNQTSLMNGERATLGDIIKTSARVASNGTSSADLFADVQEAPTKAKENTTQAKDKSTAPTREIHYSAEARTDHENTEDTAYMEQVDRYQNAATPEEKQAALKSLQDMVRKAAEDAGFTDAVPEQTVAYKTRTKAAPRKTVKVYKVFTVSPDGSPTALFIGGTEKLPQGVWLDAQPAYHFKAKNGLYYVPSTKNPYTKGGKTGATVEIPNEKVRQELIERGFLAEGSKAQKVTALAYRPGWHAGTLPFFPQGGMRPPKGMNTSYKNIHRYNQVVFECELAADKDYTHEAEQQPKARNKDGSLNTKKADLQYLPENGYYYYATNPMTHGHPELGLWAISGSLKINRALTQEECDDILKKQGMEPQPWEGGKMNLEDLGYHGAENDAARKTLAPITYDDDGNVIPLSQRFNREIDDIRYSAKQNDAQVKRSLQAVVDEAKKAFPNAKNIRQDGGHISMDMPNGAEVQINVVPSIEVNNEEAGRARAAHGLKDDVRIKINGGERTVGRAALIELSQLGRKGTAYHEAFHAVYDMCLTNEEKAALHKAYDKEAKAKGRDVYEVMADKYRDWMLAQQKGQHTLFGKLWQKVKSAVIRLLHLIRGADNARDVFRKVGSGEVWERQLNSKDSGNRYLVTNDQIRPDTEVPIIDVTDEPKVNVNNHHAAADIARSMIGKTFRIIGSDGYGKIASVSDGTHFVHSSNNPVRFDKTRRKALSVAEKILGNCVYIEKHGDLKHGTKQSYIEMFSVVKDGNRLVRFRIVAKEGNKDSHAFRIGEAKFYDIIKDGALQESGVLRHYKHEGTPSTLTIAELLKGVKDREGHLYVNKDGSLNYDTRIFHNGEEQGGSPSDVRNSADLFAIRPGEPIRYSLDANDNSKPSLFTRAYNHLTGRKNAASHDKNVKAMLEDITKMRIRFGKLDPKTETVFKKFEGVIRARNANEWEKVLPEAGRAIADRLNLKPSEDMNNYIAKWLLDEATNDTSQEASDFAAALKNDPVLGDQLVDLKTLFNERNNREADEVVRDAIQYEKPKERTTLTKAWETFYDEMIEELGPVKRMVKRVQEKSGQELAASVNPYIALRLSRGNAGRAMTMIEGQSEAAVKALQANYPGVNFNGFKTLHMILDECGALHNEKRMKDFLAFALACHVKDIHTLNNRIRKSQQRLRDKIADLNDKINNLPEYQQLIESDKKVDDKHQEQREAYQKEIEGYQAKIDKAEKTIMEVPRTEDGLSLTEDRCNKVMMKYMKEYGEAQQDLVHFSKVTTSILYDAGVISKKRYKELQERWPNYIPMFRVFEDNEEVDFGDSLKHMHGSTRRIINPLDSIIRNTYDFVKKAEKNKARQLLADLTRISDVGEYIEEVDNSKPNDKTTITFYENGERKYLQTDPDIVKAVNNMGREESNWVLRLLHGPAKIARACFTTINPSFALRNLIRDSTDATIYSKYGFKPWDFVRGFLHAVHRDELFYEWLSSGAAQASAISLDRDYTQATLNQMSKTWKERLLSKEFLPAILEGMQMVGEYSEYGTRIAAYERAKKKLAGENGPHPAAYDLASAALESRDLMDFARGGRGSRYLNNVVVFANASIQGFDKFFRTFDFRKPYRKESMKALARLFLCGMLPALLLAGIHSGDDWWEELPDWQKETNWILGKVGNTIIRIPKGQDIGLRFFSNLIEKAMDRSKHKAGDYFKPVWDSLPDMIPTALLPIIEATANHSYFTGAPVVPKYQEKLPAYLQFGNETSSFAKFVGKVIGVSPRKVEHVLFGYTGNMGKGLLGVYDTIVGNQSLNTNLNEAPVISGFTAIPYKQSKTVNDFYDKFDEQRRLNEEFKLTKKKPDGYDPSLYKRMTKAQQELSKINKQERAAIDDPKMDSGVREQKQLGYQQQRLSVVRRVMGQ